MTLLDISAPDDLIESYLVEIFGPAAFLAIAFKLYVLVTSWAGAVSTGRRGVRVASSAVRRALAVGWVAAVAAILAILGVIAIFAVWITLSSTMGYGASYLFHRDIPLSGPRLEPFLSWRQDDGIHSYHIWWSLIVATFPVLYWFYRRPVDGKWEVAAGAGFLFALPWTLFGLLMVLLSVTYGIGGAVNWFSGKGFQVDVYGVALNLAVYMVVAITAFGYSWTATMVGGCQEFPSRWPGGLCRDGGKAENSPDRPPGPTRGSDSYHAVPAVMQHVRPDPPR